MAGLADILVQQGVVSPEQLQQAEAHLQQQGGSLGQALIDLRIATEADLVRALAGTLGMPFLEVDGQDVDPNAAAMLPGEVSRELGALPVGFGEGDTLLVAIADPNQQGVAERVQAETGLPVTLGLAPRRALVQAIEHHAGAPGAGAAPPPPAPASPPPAAPPAGGPEGPLGAPGGGPGPDAAGAPPTPGPLGSNGAGAHVPPAERETTLGREPTGFGEPAGPTVMSEEAASVDLDDLLVALVDRGGSDLHLTAGVPPTIRIDGDLTPLEEYPVLKPNDLQKMLYGIMTQKQREAFENELELDMSYSVVGKSRFRVNVFQQRDAIGSVMRTIPFEILPLEKLGIPEQVANLAYLPRGFVLVTGPTGSGKSTTLASLIDLINRNRPAHIMTVEDPIEFLHSHKRSVVNQREVGTDTKGFNQALKHVLRQDPDVILVGEMRDLETIQIALTAAETGHLVFGTLHTQDAPQTIDRIVDVFPPDQQEQIRVMLAGALKGVVCQTLMKTSDGKGRAAAVEIMMTTSGVQNLIREGKTHQIYSSIQAGAKDGMIAMDQSLAQLVKSGRVSYDAALEKANNVNEFNRLVGRG